MLAWPAYEYDDDRTLLLGPDVAAHAASQQLLEVMPTHSAGAQTPDSALVAQAAAGDERALGGLYDRYGGMSFSLACAIVGQKIAIGLIGQPVARAIASGTICTRNSQRSRSAHAVAKIGRAHV